MTCQQIEALLPPFVDGLAVADDRARVEAHLSACPPCLRLAEAQRAAARMVRQRAGHLVSPAPPGLRTRIMAACREEAAVRPRVPALGWGGRVSAFAAAAGILLIVGVAALPTLTARSSTLLAAQLAIDHVKCFSIDGDASRPEMSVDQATAALREHYGFDITVPRGASGQGACLVAVRRCLYGDGLGAHLLYRVDGQPVSLFVLPGLERPAAELGLLGHDEIVWNRGGRTYMLVARHVGKSRLRHLAQGLMNEAE